MQRHCDTSQFLLIHRKNSDSEIKDEPSSAHGEHENTMGKDICVGKDICKETEKTTAEYGLQWSNCLCDYMVAVAWVILRQA